MTNMNISNLNEEKNMLNERYVLSALLMNEKLIGECDLELDMFTFPLHKSIYQKVKNIYQKKGCLDLVDLYTDSEYGMNDYIMRLQEEYFTSANFYNYVSNLQETYKLNLASKWMEKCQNKEILSMM